MEGESIEVFSAKEDKYGGIILTVIVNEPMEDSLLFASKLEASISHWKQQGKKGMWIKLPIQHSNLVDPAVKVTSIAYIA